MRVYLSHKISGGDGNASFTDMKKNCDEAIKIGQQIRGCMSNSIELYIPAESEPFVGVAFKDGYLTIHEILDIDCKIIDTCDIVIIYVPDGDELQGGRLVEHDYAVTCADKLIYIFSDAEQAIGYLIGHVLRGDI